jgi:hypothetical protein
MTMLSKTAENRYDVIIVGAGPAGIFCAYEIIKHSNLKVLIIEKGPSIEKRVCPQQNGGICRPCKTCYITTGWGGAGAFSDGKLTLSSDVGGWLTEIVERDKVDELIGYVKETFRNFGAEEREFRPPEEEARRLYNLARISDLKLITFPIMHLGSDRTPGILKNFFDYLKEKIDIKFKTPARIIRKAGNNDFEVITDKESYRSRFVVIAPGREGAEWLHKVCSELNIPVENNAVDIGVRVEVAAEVMKPVTDILYEAKLIYTSRKFEDKVRTFCMNPYGEVTTEVYEDVITVNGHSFAERKTENTNFAILVSKNFTEPFKEPIAYGKYIARLANILSGGIIVQRLQDIKLGRRSTYERLGRSIVEPTLKEAVPGDLSLVFPYRHLSSILEMLEAMDKMIPGVASRNTLLYGVEVKFYSARVSLNSELETPVRNLFAAGDGAGITRGLVQSSVSGIIAARAILKRNNLEVS